MCRDCLFEVRPRRGSVCLETGAYVLNFRGCVRCGSRQRPRAVAHTREEDEDDDEVSEEITFRHVCATPGCGHVIAEHFYRYRGDDRLQTYLMECVLCGFGADERPTLRRRAAQVRAAREEAPVASLDAATLPPAPARPAASSSAAVLTMGAGTSVFEAAKVAEAARDGAGGDSCSDTDWD